MIRVLSIVRLWCVHCGFKTDHRFVDVQGTDGTVWKCTRCERTREATAHQLLTAEQR